MDLYDFDQDDYVESRENDFSASFIDEMCDDDSSDSWFYSWRHLYG